MTDDFPTDEQLAAFINAAADEESVREQATLVRTYWHALRAPYDGERIDEEHTLYLTVEWMKYCFGSDLHDDERPDDDQH